MVSFNEVLIAEGPAPPGPPIPSPSRKTLSTTESSVAVVSRPVYHLLLAPPSSFINRRDYHPKPQL